MNPTYPDDYTDLETYAYLMFEATRPKKNFEDILKDEGVDYVG